MKPRPKDVSRPGGFERMAGEAGTKVRSVASERKQLVGIELDIAVLGAFFWIASIINLYCYYRGVRPGPIGFYGRGIQAAPLFALTTAALTVGFLVAGLLPIDECAPDGLVGCEAPLAPLALALTSPGVVLIFVTLKEMYWPNRWRRLPSWWCDRYDPDRPEKYRRYP